MTLRTTTLAVSVSLLALLGACGDDDSASDTSSTSTTEATADLAAFLLTPEDLATGDPLDAGWIIGDVSAGVEIDLPDCLLENPTSSGSVEAKLVTDNDLKLPSLEQDLTPFVAGGAAAAFNLASTRLDGCEPEFVFQGTPSTGMIERLELTIDADQSAAWRTTVTIAGVDVAITNIHLVDGVHGMSFVHVDTGTPDPAVLEGYVATALAKLPS